MIQRRGAQEYPGRGKGIPPKAALTAAWDWAEQVQDCF